MTVASMWLQRLTYIFVGIGLVLVLIAAPVRSSAEMRQVTLFDGALSIDIPTTLEPMSDKLRRLKYPGANRPPIAYADENGTVTVAINFTDYPAPPAHLPEIKEHMQATLETRFPSARWYSAELAEINGAEFFMLHLESPAIDTKINNRLVGASLNGRLLLVTFNTTVELQDIWEPIGAEIIQSIRLRPSR